MFRLPPLASSSRTALFALTRPSRGLAQQTILRQYSTGEHTCPNCSAPLPTPLPVCPKCAYIAPVPASMSHHEILGQPYEPNPFVVDQAAVKQRFRELQTVIHPDRWAGQGEEKLAAAATISARLNNALHNLQHPLRRVEYILLHEGHARDEEESLEDPSFLMEIMELREAVESAESQANIDEIKSENIAMIEQTIEEIQGLVAAKDWPTVQKAAIKLKYLTGIDNAATSWPEHVSDH